MKKILPLIVIIFISVQTVFLEIPVAYSETESGMLRVITEDTPFYCDTSQSEILFYLPYTYYVKVLKKGENLTHVEYCSTNGWIALDGYVPTDKLYADNLEVVSPYPCITITTSKTAILYFDGDLTLKAQYVFPERKLKYYGALPYQDGTKIYYVEYNDKLGYVKEDCIYPFTVENHPNELTFIKTEEPVEQVDAVVDVDGETENKSFSETTLKIIILCSLTLAGILALCFAIKKRQPEKPSGSYYDENDYE